MSQLSDEEIANVLTYVSEQLGQQGLVVSTTEVAARSAPEAAKAGLADRASRHDGVRS